VVGRGEQDPQRFWLSVLGALRGTSAGLRGLVRELTAAPDLDGWAVVERLLKDLTPLADRLWLVIDDMHELRSAEALAQLELPVMPAPPELRFVLATRHDLRLGLHRLRLERELSEIRTADLQFTQTEARELLPAAGVALPEPALAMLDERAEGWAAGLRLAALSLAGHEDPERFAAEFSGSERTVTDYLLAEVLERQPDEVRRLLLRTSVLERVSGPLADALTGGSGANGCWRSWSRQTRSWYRWTRGGPGSATTTCSPTCCSWRCDAPRRPRSPRCTRQLPGDSRSTGSRWRRSATHRRRRTGAWPPGCSPITGPACSWAGRPPPCT
jgi:hypothetical protein